MLLPLGGPSTWGSALFFASALNALCTVSHVRRKTMFIEWYNGGLWFRAETEQEGEALLRISDALESLGLIKERFPGPRVDGEGGDE